jgi:hypothetical protein
VEISALEVALGKRGRRMIVAIHIARNSPKQPTARFSIYAQFGHKWGWSWRRKDGTSGFRMMIARRDSKGPYWYQVDDRVGRSIRRRRRFA